MFTRGFKLVEAAGQRFHIFRSGLDYAFIPRLTWDAGHLIRLLRILVPAQADVNRLQRVYESLQGSPEISSLATPRRYHIAWINYPCNSRLHRCEPRFHFALTGRGDPDWSNPRPKTFSAKLLHAFPLFCYSRKPTPGGRLKISARSISLTLSD